MAVCRRPHLSTHLRVSGEGPQLCSSHTGRQGTVTRSRLHTSPASSPLREPPRTQALPLCVVLSPGPRPLPGRAVPTAGQVLRRVFQGEVTPRP